MCLYSVCVGGGAQLSNANYDVTLSKFGDSPLIQCTTTGTVVKANMSRRIPIYSRDDYLARMDHKLRVSVRCMCLISV